MLDHLNHFVRLKDDLTIKNLPIIRTVDHAISGCFGHFTEIYELNSEMDSMGSKIKTLKSHPISLSERLRQEAGFALMKVGGSRKAASRFSYRNGDDSAAGLGRKCSQSTLPMLLL
jgi:hypothetical protein